MGIIYDEAVTNDEDFFYIADNEEAFKATVNCFKEIMKQ